MKTIKTIFCCMMCGFTVCGYSQTANNNTAKADVFLNNATLQEISMNVKLINAIDYTPAGFLLLASSDQFYVLGQGGMIPAFKKTKYNIDAFAIDPSDSTLLIISKNKLYQIDSSGDFVETLKLPGNNMGIVAGKQGVYIFDRERYGNIHSVYLVSNNPLSYIKLFSMPDPIASMFEYRSSIFFSTENKLFCTSIKSKTAIEIFSLPQKEDKIISMIADSIHHTFYFSTDKAVYGIKDKNVEYISNEFGGILRYDGEGLIIFHPETNFIMRLRNNILYDIAGQTPVNPTEQPKEEATVSPDPVSTVTLPDKSSAVEPSVSIPIPAVEETTATETSVEKTQSPQSESSDPPAALPANVKEAIDYVSEVKELVDLLQIKQKDFTNTILNWDQQINVILEETERTNAAIAKTEKELEDTKNSAATGLTQKINELRNGLNIQRNILKQVKQKQADKGTEIIKQLQEIAKRDAGDIGKQFGETAKRITPVSTFPALSKKRTKITFSEEPKKPLISTYLKAVDGLPVWYWNVEKSFLKTIDEQNLKAQKFIDEDAKLSIRRESLREQLSEYQKEPKIRKKEIKDLKKEVAAVEKERKNVS
ncbi:MAG: hypothetical protein LBK97_04355, partial [Prevotellaceae bacterium]|nr:hypothetical protein [Prevotellaceae bacterium]